MDRVTRVHRGERSANLLDELLEDRMVERAKAVKEFFDCHALIAEIFHEYLSLGLVDQVHSWSWHAHPPNPIHGLDFLHHSSLREFLVQSWNSIRFLEPLLDDARLSPQVCDEKPALCTL